MKVILTSRLFCYTLKAYFFHLDLFLDSRWTHLVHSFSSHRPRIAIFWRVSVPRLSTRISSNFHKSWEIFEEADGRNWMKKDWRRKGRRIKRGGKEIGAANKVTLKEGEARFKEGCKGTKVEQIPRGGAAKLCRVTAFWKEEAQRDRRKIWGNAVLKRSYDCSFLPSFLSSCTIWNSREVVFARMNNTRFITFLNFSLKNWRQI